MSHSFEFSREKVIFFIYDDFFDGPCFFMIDNNDYDIIIDGLLLLIISVSYTTFHSRKNITG